MSICLAAAIIAVYWPVYKYDFTKYDDDVYVTNNKNIQAGFDSNSIEWAFTSGNASNWHPLTWLSHMLDYQLYGKWAGGHHITNVLFHIANTLLLFYFLKKATTSFWSSAFTAAAFALHPLHVESVAWIAERKDVLSAFFWILTMIAYVYYAKSNKFKWYIITMVLFALGLMSKPMLVTLPFVLLLLDYWPLERKFTKGLILEKIPFLFLSLLSSIVTFIVQQRGGAITVIEHYGFISRAGNIIVSYGEYIFKMIWPSKLAVLYPYPTSGVEVNKIIISGVLLLSISIMIFKFSRKHKFFLFGWLFYLGTLVPVIGFIQIGAHSMADRYTYIPLTGIFIIIFFGAKELFQKYKFLFLPGIVIIISWTAIASAQVKYWKNSLTLFAHTLNVTNDNFVIMTNYAASLNEAGRYEEASKYSRKLIEMKPQSAENHNSQGSSLYNLGRNREAIEQFELAIKYKQDFPQAYFNLGIALRKINNLEKAADALKKAIHYKPDYMDAYINLVMTLNEMQEFQQAIEFSDKALLLESGNEFIRGHRAIALSALGRIDEAIKEIENVLSVRPDDAQMYRNLGILLSQKGLKSQAAEAFRKALQISPSDENTRNQLNQLIKDPNG